MTDATVIGLGAMGSAIARSLLKAGHSVTVWNRSAPRLQAMAEAGAEAAPSLGAAIAASATLFTCLDNQTSVRPLLDTVGDRLAGKTLIDLSTGQPAGARQTAAWVAERGGQYLDAKMLMGPHAIGTPNGILIYAGPRALYDGLEPMLKTLAGHTHHVGADVGSTAALDLAWLTATFGLFLGVAHGARICEAEGVAVDMLAVVFPHMPTARWLADAIARRDFENPGASIEMWRAALTLIRDQAADKTMTAEVPDFIGGILDRAIAAGHGRHHIGAVVEVMAKAQG